MAATADATRVVYELEGTLLEACSCGVLCPCWIGEDPDGGACDAFNAYHFDRGTIGGVDVSGLNYVRVVHHPGQRARRRRAGSRSCSSTTARATSSPQAILDAYDGKLGGPLADLAGLIGETLGVERAADHARGPRRRGHASRSATSWTPRCTRTPARTARRPRCATRCSPPSRARPPTSPSPTSTRSGFPSTAWQWSLEGRNAIQADYELDRTRVTHRHQRDRGGPGIAAARRGIGRGVRPGRRGQRRAIVRVAWALGGTSRGPAGDALSALHHDAADRGQEPAATRLAWLACSLVAWQTMIAAMMLPSSLPLVRLFARVSRRPAAPAARRWSRFLGGYALVWTAFGALAFAGDALVHAAVAATPWLRAHEMADRRRACSRSRALLQFTRLKDRCLTECRHPGAFLLRHYRRGTAGAFMLGRRHGLFCLGCCWALMLVMFAAGVANLSGWQRSRP